MNWQSAFAEARDRNGFQEYGFLEFQANSFAGLVLVPKAELQDAFLAAVEAGQQVGIDFDDIGCGAREAAEDFIARRFEVSADVVHRRIERDELWNPME